MENGKDCFMTNRCTASEQEKIVERIEKSGLSASEYSRMKCLNFEPKNAMTDEDKIRYHEILETRKDLKAFLDELNVKLKDYTPEARLAYLLSDATFRKWADAIGDVLHDLDLIRIKYAGQK